MVAVLFSLVQNILNISAATWHQVPVLFIQLGSPGEDWASLYVWGPPPQVAPIWSMITHSLPFSPGGASILDRQQEALNRDSERQSSRASIFTQNLSCLGAVPSLLKILKIKLMLSTVTVEIWAIEL